MTITRRTAMKWAGLAALPAPGISAPAEDKVPLILDTDIGSDIDDALTVAYLLCQERCDLLGFTTCYGDTMARAGLVSALLTHAGRDIPIHPGSPRLLGGKTVEGKVPQAEVLPRWPHRTDFKPESAVEFLYESIKSRPGEITLLATGPLTNVAALFEAHPDAAGLLKSLALMNGSFRFMLREYNAARDAEAARIVYETPVRELSSVDFETSLQCRLGAREAREKIQGGLLAPVADMLAVWLRQAPAVIFYDSLAAASIFHPGLVKWKKVRVASRHGFTFPLPDPNGPHLVSVDVDQARFQQHYFATVSRAQG